MATIDTSRWSGDGEFTKTLIEVLETTSGVAAVRVEDAPSTRSDSNYLFLSNEVFIQSDVEVRHRPRRMLGVIPWRERVAEPLLTLPALEQLLAADERVGPPDVSEYGMLQYLKTERIIPPYQTRGYKLVELVRVYLLVPVVAP
jgi:hypothetical protein